MISMAKFGIVISIATSIATVGTLTSNQAPAYAGCGWGDIAVATLLRTFLAVCFASCRRCLCPNLCGDGYITCNPSKWTCPVGGCPQQSQSTVGQDMTPPKVRIARDLMGKGYSCIEVSEYPLTTCAVPSGMGSNQFSKRFVSFQSSYLGDNRGWSWDCLNRNGQLWGASNGQLWCQTGMR